MVVKTLYLAQMFLVVLFHKKGLASIRMEDSMAFFKRTSLKPCPPNLILLSLCFHTKPIIRFHVAANLENISPLESLCWLTLIPKIVGPISKGICCQILDFCHHFYCAFMQNLRFEYYMASWKKIRHFEFCLD